MEGVLFLLSPTRYIRIVMAPTLYLRPLRALTVLALAGLVFFLLAASARAQTGTIAGVVVDEDTGETLIGVNVTIDALGTGAATGLDGDYRIAGLPAGSYDVTFSYVGYTQQRVTGVTVTSGQTASLDVGLAEETLELEGGGEVVVEATALRNNEAALLKDRQKAAAVSDAISAETISKSGSSDAADAMERVTGAAVEGGKYIIVRGLGDRYANTQLNGAELPTADPDRKAVQFDLFPSNLLDNIVTLKTFTPDKPGNFSGGLVDISTKSFPSELDVRFSASGSANSQNVGADVLTYAGGDTDWLGIDDGTRSLPDLLADPSVEIPGAIQSRRSDSLAFALDGFSKAFGTSMALMREAAPVNQSYAASLGDQRQVLGNPLGYIFSLTYNRASSYYGDGFTGRYGFSQRTEDGTVLLAPELLLGDARGTTEASWGGIGNLTYRLGPRNEIGLNSLYSRSAESTARFQVGSFPEQFAGDSTALFINRTLLYTERELYSFQLRGEHQIPALLGTTVEWNSSLSQTSLDEPDLRFFPNVRRDTPNGTVYGTQSSGFNGPLRFFRAADEGLRSAALDVTTPYALFGRSGQVKLGGYYQRTDRTGSERRFRIVPAQAGITLQPGDDGYGDVDAFLSPENLGIVGADTLADGSLRYVFGNTVEEERSPVVRGNNYDGSLDVPAAYVMAEVPVTRRLRAIGGVRYEATRQAVTSGAYDPDALAEGDSVFVGGRIESDDLLPSLNLVYALTDAMNLRAAATRTHARPTFREFSPACRFDFALSDLVCGNPDLERSLITNADLRWEWFTRPGEILALSGYYKNIAEPIERVFVNANGEQTYNNVDNADIYGVEVEARKRLDTVAPLLRHVSLGLNLSFIQSSVSVDSTELRLRREIDPNAADTRALQGQSPFIVNADLAYDNLESGTSVGVYFNVFGRRLSTVSFGSVPDVYEQPSPQLDFVASQQLFRDWSVKVSAKNLLDASFRQVYDAAYNGQDAVYQEYKRGLSFSIGISYSPRFGGGAPPSVPTPSDSPVPTGAGR